MKKGNTATKRVSSMMLAAAMMLSMSMSALAADAGVAKSGNVSVADLSAGEWSGNFDFNISITEPDAVNP